MVNTPNNKELDEILEKRMDEQLSSLSDDDLNPHTIREIIAIFFSGANVRSNKKIAKATKAMASHNRDLVVNTRVSAETQKWIKWATITIAIFAALQFIIEVAKLVLNHFM